MTKKYVPRTCTRILDFGEKETQPLAFYRHLPAYVLLGDSGAGKTTAFKTEAQECGGEYITARDFITVEGRKEQSNTVLFIDGLDEIRIGAHSPFTSIDSIRKHLSKLNAPFRLSCREADWLGKNDREALQFILPEGIELIVLHLDKLTKENIKEILRNRNVDHPEDFIEKAREHHLQELLYNPQVLDLLIEAVSKNQAWPENRSEIYEMACSKLISEENSDHRRHSNDSHTQLLNNAGYLCAIQLLAGIAGFALDKDSVCDQYIDIKKLPTPKGFDLSKALPTKIFVHDGEERRIPVHRSVAEYLGAKYLAYLMNKKECPLPFERVLALMPDETGAIASDLRGLCAWLAVHCMERERSILIKRDPLGIVIYGDVTKFSSEEKKMILNTFKNKAKNADWPHFNSSFGALGTTDMVPVFRSMLASPTHTIEEQKLYTIILSAIAYGQPMPELKDVLESIIRDYNYISEIRSYAIEALFKCGKHSLILLKIAKDIRDGILEDRDDEVLGNLLGTLYPTHITTNEILSYFHQRKNLSFLGSYFSFWNDLVVLTKDEMLLALLDQLVQKKADFKWMAEDRNTMRWMGKLLLKGLEIDGEKVKVKRLYDWLSLGISEFGTSLLERDEAKAVAAWFEARPEKYKAVIEYGAILCADEDNFDICMRHCSERLQNAICPANMLEWYQEKMKLVLREYPQVENVKQEYLSWQQKQKLTQQKEKIERTARFREYLKSMLEGKAPASIIYELAQSYNGRFSNIYGATPDERLKDLLNDDQELVDAAYSSLKSAIFREDLPTVDKIVELATETKTHFLCPACLISVAELHKNDPSRILKLNDFLLRQLLAFRFTDDWGDKEEPEWVLSLINEKPALVEEVLSQYLSAMIKAEKEFISPLSRLIDGEYTHFAPAILPTLLAIFPLRVSQDISKNILGYLLRGAMQFLDKETLASIINKRLANRSMEATQKVYWLACGFMIAPAKFTKKLQKHIAKNQAYQWHLSNFIQNNWGKNRLSADMDEKATGFLIKFLAPECSPEQLHHQVTADLVYNLIYKLQHGSNQSSSELERLLSIHNISTWHPLLEKALHAKKITQSISSFRYPKVGEIAATLENGPPANAADLCALTMVYLRQIANEICNGNTNDKKQYWSYDENRKLTIPKPENDCRDALLSDLKPRLKLYQVMSDKESYYVDETRADIKVSFNGFNIPIEIKKEDYRGKDNQNLWTTIREQLIKKYVRDPGTSGYGIYIVFWFGKKNIIDPNGTKIRSPEQLEDQLRQTLIEEERRRIEILVIDCSLFPSDHEEEPQKID